MAICDVCSHEYLDSYEECPFCARRAASRERILSERAPVRKRRVSPVLVGVVTAVGSLSAVLVYVGVQFALGAATIPGASDAVERQVCFDNERTVERLSEAYTAQFGMRTLEDPALLVGTYLERPASCPSHGRYLWDAEKAVLTCTVHGHPGEQAETP